MDKTASDRRGVCKVGVDVRHLRSAYGTGGARVLVNCLRALETYCNTDIEVVYYNEFRHPFFLSRIGKLLAGVFADMFIKNICLPFWCRRKKIDVLFYALPPISLTARKIPQICYILDVPLDQEERAWSNRIYNDIYIKQSCLNADILLTISRSVVGRIVERYNVDPQKVKVAYLSADIDYIKRVEPCDPTLKCAGFVVGVLSRICWRKNPGAYLEIYSLLPESVRTRYPLVLIGAMNSIDDFSDYVSDEVINNVRGNVVCLGRVSDEDLIGYIKGADALLFPSYYEGFGLPVLEAVVGGTPVIASNIPVFQELFSEVAQLFDPDDYMGMADALKALLLEPRVGVLDVDVDEWSSKFSFEIYAKRMQEIIEESSHIR